MGNFNIEHKKVLDGILLNNPLIRPGKMFGYPAYYVGKKLCICLYENGVGVKLPEHSASRLILEDPNIIPFQPLGKSRMREWIQIDLFNSEDYLKYQSIFEEAIQFSITLQADGK